MAQNCGEQTCAANNNCVPQKYYFVQLLAGGSSIFNSGSEFCNSVSPAYSVSAGAMFSSVVGARVNVTGFTSKNELQSINKYYKFNYVNTNIDVMLNLYKLFAKCPNQRFNAFFIAGAGFNYAWNNDDFVNLTQQYATAITEDANGSWGFDKSHKDLFSGNIRAGVMLDFVINKNWSVGIEGDINHVSDRLNGKMCGGSDWNVTGQFAVTYKFGHKVCKK